MSDVDLRVDWCSYEAAKYAVEKWHYSRNMPSSRGKWNNIGIWEDGLFVGAIVFTMGVSASLHRPYEIDRLQVCELQRVAMTNHGNHVTRCIAKAISLLKAKNPGLRLIVSFADQYQEHLGIIYQAGNWIYVGETGASINYFDKKTGRARHSRNVGKVAGKDATGVMIHSIDEVTKEIRPPKHKYLYPLDRAMRKQIAPLAKPYPKRQPCGPSVEGDTSGDQPEGAGSIPAARSEVQT